MLLTTYVPFSRKSMRSDARYRRIIRICDYPMVCVTNFVSRSIFASHRPLPPPLALQALFWPSRATSRRHRGGSEFRHRMSPPQEGKWVSGVVHLILIFRPPAVSFLVPCSCKTFLSSFEPYGPLLSLPIDDRLGVLWCRSSIDGVSRRAGIGVPTQLALRADLFPRSLFSSVECQ